MQNFKCEIDYLLANKNYSLAMKMVKAKQKKQSKNSEMIRLEGIILLHQNKLSLSEKVFKKALCLDSKNFTVMNNIAFVKQYQGEYVESVKWLKKSISINSNSVDAHHQLGIVASLQKDFDLAEIHFKKVLDISNNHNECLINLGVLLKNKGEIKSAVTYLHHALSINPMQAQVYWILANLKSYQFQESEKVMVRSLLKSVQSPKDKEALLFTEAKILESEEKYAESFSVLKQANINKYNSMLRKHNNWPMLLEQIKSVFTQDYIVANQNNESQDITPVLIAGMPRSGSTLVEQILASHSNITGASELNYLHDLVNRDAKPYPLNLKNSGIERYTTIARKYLTLTRRWSRHSKYFTDKMPRNINYAGTLLLAIPNARLIHTRRNAMDVCLSAYKQNFENGNEYSYDLVELVQYYKFQEQLADHWKSLFPGRVTTVNYEKLIDNTEHEVRSLLDFLSLVYEPNCLKFYHTKRAIVTASAGQVTQELYTNAVNHYKKYGTSINELSELLKQPFES